ncbi:MAG: response regulator [Gemmatimonadaceae bacterium]|nr:response regulator [Gemmatimonadaceae bacterium]
MSSAPKSPAPRRASLRARMRAVAVFVAIAFALLAWLRARDRQLAEQRLIGERASDNAQAVTRALDAQIGQVQTLLQSLHYVVDLNAPASVTDSVLRVLHDRMVAPYSNLFLADTAGQVLGAARILPAGRAAMNISDRPYFQEVARTQRFTVGDPVRSRALPDSVRIMPFIAPITDQRTGQPKGYVGASILVDSLEGVQMARRLPPGSVLTVLNANGRIIVRTLDSDRWIGKMFPGFSVRGQAEQPVGTDTIVPSDIDHVDRLFGSEYLRSIGWRAYVGIPVSEVFRAARLQFVYDLAIGILGGLVVVFVAYWVTARLLTPIESLTLDARAISEGDMRRRSQLSSDDEVGELARTFNAMADAIVDREAALTASQDRLREAQKLEALGSFAGGIAHDFNNYLSSILGHAELAREIVPVGHEARTEIDHTIDAARRAADLTRQILVFSRQQVVEPRLVNPNDIVRGIERLIARVLGESITFTSQYDDRTGSIRVDPGRLEQVLMNLATNARDAMPRGGEFYISVSRLQVHAGSPLGIEPGNYVCYTARDSGDGIPKEVLDRVFEPFFTTKERGRGTGLGLAIAYGIVKQAGGAMSVESAPGVGTTLRVMLPELDRPADAEERAAEELPPPGQERLLVVDDEPAVAKIAERLLQQAGYAVESAIGARDALTRFETQHFDMVISDVVMPGMSGPELVRELTRRRPELRVLFVSGYADDDALVADIAARQVAFLPKPFSRASLLHKVRDVLDGKKVVGKD